MKKAIAKAMKEYEEYTMQINELLKKQAACKEMLREEVLNYGQLKYKGITCSCVTRTTIKSCHKNFIRVLLMIKYRLIHANLRSCLKNIILSQRIL